MIWKHKGPECLSLGELIDIGWRLSERQLENMDLLKAVEKAEEENVSRLKASIKLLKPLTCMFSDTLIDELKRAKSQLANPKRGQAIEVGRAVNTKGRTFPEPGTIFNCLHEYRYGRKVKNSDGTDSYKYSDTFRFLVVEQPSKLLRLDEPRGPIYLSPSKAITRATGSSGNGWRFLGY